MTEVSSTDASNSSSPVVSSVASRRGSEVYEATHDASYEAHPRIVAVSHGAHDERAACGTCDTMPPLRFECREGVLTRRRPLSDGTTSSGEGYE